MPTRSTEPRRRPPPAAQIVTRVAPVDLSPARVRRRFRELLDSGAALRPAGTARHDPAALLDGHYLPRHELHLFDATFFLTDLLFDEALGFLIAYVVLGERSDRRSRSIHPRIFYKDSSLMWRVASHFVHDEHEYWIGKGDVEIEVRGDHEHLATREETTNLPFELQFALDDVSRRKKRRRDDEAVALVLRQAPSGRIEPYADFSRPRRVASARCAIHDDRPIARFRRRGDPRSLSFARGFEPDFEDGLLEEHRSHSKFFGGELRKLRILSTNRTVQFLFFASPTHAWMAPPQALSTELSSYGVRTVDVFAPEELSIPGYEYHEDGHSQIPAGYVGAPNPLDPHRSDASAWLERLPVIEEFRAKVLRRQRARSASS